MTGGTVRRAAHRRARPGNGPDPAVRAPPSYQDASSSSTRRAPAPGAALGPLGVVLRRRTPGRRCRGGPTASSPTNSWRNRPAVMAPPCGPRRCSSCRRRSSRAACGSRAGSGSGHTGSPRRARPPAATWSTSASSLPMRPAMSWPEGHHAGAGEGGEVDDGVGLRLGGERQPVGEHQPALGVGVEHLGGLAVAEA